jgi:hypothetical protein
LLPFLLSLFLSFFLSFFLISFFLSRYSTILTHSYSTELYAVLSRLIPSCKAT